MEKEKLENNSPNSSLSPCSQDGRLKSGTQITKVRSSLRKVRNTYL